MRFLIEKSILEPDEQNYFDRLTSLNAKVKFAEKVLNTHENADNLKSSKTIYIDSLVDDGFDPNTNDFLYFMEHIDIDLPTSIVELLKELVDDGKLDVQSTFLYEDSLYDGDFEFISKKIKLLALALNPSLQRHLTQEITLEDILDGTKFRSKEEIEKLLHSTKMDTSKSSKYAKTLDDVKDVLSNNLIDDVVDTLTSLGVGKEKARAIALDHFESTDTIETLIRKALKDLDR